MGLTNGIAGEKVKPMEHPIQTMSDRNFDEQLNTLVEKAIMDGVKPIVVVGCLQFTICDVYAWDARNKAAVRAAKASQVVHEAVDAMPNGKISSILHSGVAPSAKVAAKSDGVIVKLE